MADYESMRTLFSLTVALTLIYNTHAHAADVAAPAAQRDDAAWLRENGTLIFADSFDREEDGNGLKAIGNGCESATADRVPHIKQADLDDGILKIASDGKAVGHGIHIHHDAGFANGGTTLRFRFPGRSKSETLTIGHVDRSLAGVHAGHLCYANPYSGGILLRDNKTGDNQLRSPISRP